MTGQEQTATALLHEFLRLKNSLLTLRLIKRSTVLLTIKTRVETFETVCNQTCGNQTQSANLPADVEPVSPYGALYETYAVLWRLGQTAAAEIETALQAPTMNGNLAAIQNQLASLRALFATANTDNDLIRWSSPDLTWAGLN